MAITLTQQVYADMLTAYVAAKGSFTLHLFNSSITPSSTDTASTYSGSEATFTGYSAPTMVFPSPPTVATPSVYGAAGYAFTCSAPVAGEDIYGAYILDGGGSLVGAQLFSSPVHIQFAGDQITISPSLTMAQC